MGAPKGRSARSRSRAKVAYNRAKVEEKKAASHETSPQHAVEPIRTKATAPPSSSHGAPGIPSSVYPAIALLAIPWAGDFMAVVKAIPPVRPPTPPRCLHHPLLDYLLLSWCLALMGGVYAACIASGWPDGLEKTFTFAMHCVYTCVSYRKDLESQKPGVMRRVAVTLSSSFAGSLVAALVFSQVASFFQEVAAKLPVFLLCWVAVDILPADWFRALKLREAGAPAAARSAIYVSEGLYKHSGLLKAWKVTPALGGCDGVGVAGGLPGALFCVLFGGVRGGASTLSRGIDFAFYGQFRKAVDTSKTELRRYAALSAANLWSHAALCGGGTAAAAAAMAAGGAGGAMRAVAAAAAWGHPVALAQWWASGSELCGGAAGAGGWLERSCRAPDAALDDFTKSAVLLYVISVYLQKAKPRAAVLRGRAGEVRVMASAVATMQRGVGKKTESEAMQRGVGKKTESEGKRKHKRD